MILYEGPSRFDGAPLVVIATGYARPSGNPKTGPVVQTWIMRADLHPQEARIQGADRSMCGDCLHLGAKPSEASCYVVLHTAGNIWKQYRAGAYPVARSRRDYFRASCYGVRLGSYGDPAAVPWDAWKPLIRAAPWCVGYTHFPERAGAELRRVCMASADSLTQARRYQAAGWRTYRVLAPGERPERNERVCPASREGGRQTVCLACRLCDGAQRADGDQIAEWTHGSRGAYFVRNRARFERTHARGAAAGVR